MSKKVIIGIIVAIIVILGFNVSLHNYTKPYYTEWYLVDTDGNKAEVGVIKSYKDKDNISVYLPTDGKWYDSASEEAAKLSINMVVNNVTKGNSTGLHLRTREIRSPKEAMTNEGKYYEQRDGKTYIMEEK